MTHAIIGESWWRDIATELDIDCAVYHQDDIDALVADSHVQSLWCVSTPVLSHRIDLRDGMAKLIGACDVVVRQPTGATSLLVGFAVASRALAPVIRRHVSSISRLVILGGEFLASSAIAAGIELGAAEIVVVTDPIGGPGSAVAAAHNMGVDIRVARPADVVIRRTDVVIDCSAHIRRRVLQQEVPETLIRTYCMGNTYDAHEYFDEFICHYLRDLIVVATGRDLTPSTIKQAVDNILGH